MAKKILISVVVPAYNEEKTIKRCLAALKNQSFPAKDYEIIVVDNNSSDKTAQIAKKMGARVVLEKRQGYVFAIKKGCDAALGKIVVITDADSRAFRDWLKKFYTVFQKDKDIVCVGGGTIHDNPRTLLVVLVELSYNLVSPLFKAFPGYNLAFLKSAYDKIGGFREEINMCADTDLCMRMGKQGKRRFLLDNKILTSGRRFRNRGAMAYILKGLINDIWLILFKKTIFFDFGEVRE
jgi:glycosyltransferase involved in cell wall biosynthesis